MAVDAVVANAIKNEEEKRKRKKERKPHEWDL